MILRSLTVALLGAAFVVAASAQVPAAPAPLPPPAAEAPPAPAPETPADPVAQKAALAPKPDDIGLGDPNAPVTWVEYASAGCSHCAHLTLDILPQIKSAYIDTGKLYYVLRDFPLDDAAVAASLLARCMLKDKFYGFMDTLFREQQDWHSAEAKDPAAALIAKAKAAGMSDADLEACKKNQAVVDRIMAGRKEAEEVLKVDSTPTNFINGEMIVGAAPLEEFEAAIKKALGTPAP